MGRFLAILALVSTHGSAARRFAMNAARMLLAGPLLLALAGCLEVDTHIAVNGDGSGTITERVEIKGAMAQMMKQMGQGSGEFVNQAKLQQRAAELGEGVSVASASPLPPAEGVGAVAMFAFEDLNTVRLAHNPVEDMETGGADAASAPHGEQPSPTMRFGFEPGPPATITIDLALPQPGDASPGGPGPAGSTATAMAQEMLDGFKAMLEGMRIVTVLSVAGEILETNAAYRDGNRVTLLDLPLDKLLDTDPALAEKLQPGTDIATMKAALERVAGMKIELAPQVRIVFAPGPTQATTTPMPAATMAPTARILSAAN
jgi:hypothetical protein